MATNQQTLVDLGRSLIDDARELIRKEIQLAKVELLDLVKTNAIAAGMFIGAVLMAFMAIILLQVAIVVTVPFAAQPWVAWGLVVFWIIVVAVLVIVGRRKLRFEAPEKTLATI